MTKKDEKTGENMKSKKELEDEITKLREELWDIALVDKIKENAPLIGTYAKFDNGSSAEDRWWMYRHYTHIDNKNGILVAVEFQTSSRGIFDCKINDYVSYTRGWSEITKEEFMSAWEEQTKEILSWV